MATKTGTTANDFLYGGGPDTLVGLQGDDTYVIYSAADTVVENGGEGRDTILTFANYTLGAGISVETLSTATNADTATLSLTGNALSQIVVGNYGSNTLDGGGGGDALIGLRGDDVYRVYGLTDLVVEQANEGNDTILALGNFVLGAGSSVERIAVANPTAMAGLFLGGNELNQTINGGAGNDLINGGGQVRNLGFDWLYGGAGDDVYRVFGDNQFNGSSSEVVFEFANEGNDAIYTSGNFTLTPGSGIELLSTATHAGTEAINLIGNGVGQVIIGNYGDNQIFGYNTAGLSDKGPIVGADTLIGLFGNDTYRVFDTNDVVIEEAGQGNDKVFTDTNYTLRAGTSVEMLSTTLNAATGALRFTGNEIANTLIGNFGTNTLDGGGGADTLTGLNGADAFRFSTPLGPGNVDTITDFGLGADTIELDPTIFTGLALGALPASAISYGASAADADDRVIYDPQTGALSYDADGSGAGTATRFASLPAGLAQTTIQVAVVAAPDPGAVFVTFGGTYRVGGATGPGISINEAYPQATSVTFGREVGPNTTAYSLVLGPNSASGGPRLGFSLATIDTFDFSQLGVGLTYSGANGFGTTAGGRIEFAPRPTSTASTVPITIVGTPFADVIDRTDGLTSFGRTGIVRGGAGNDTLTGGAELYGDEGDDRLVGVQAALLVGGAGRDTFVLPIYVPNGPVISNTAPNRPGDFNSAEDRIDLVLNIASDLPIGPLAANRFGIGSAATNADQRILYDPSNGVLRFDTNGSLPDSADQRPIFAVLPPNLDLAAVSFNVILP